jgi:nitroimidazol reductase NimA-like FMN-containing flavoprotein (pyridoxamine 5'-phosphate oxidase superfamily)
MSERRPTNPLTIALAIPGDLAGLVRGSVNRAVGNARAAAAALETQSRDRQELSPRDGSGTARPGQLTRLSRTQCLQLLGTRQVGRLAYVARANTPDIVPVNYAVTSDGAILLRSGHGPKLQAADRGETVAFEVDDIDEESHTGWSVVVSGPARRLTHRDQEELATMPVPWATGPRHHVVAITPTRIDGRRLH